MKTYFNIMKKWLPFDRVIISLVLVSLLCACKSDDFLQEAQNDNECNLIITLKAPQKSSQSTTRAGVREFESQFPDEYSVKNLTLSLVTEDETIYPLVSKYIGRKDDSYQYEATLSVSEKYVKYVAEEQKYYLTARLVAVANMPSEQEAHPFGPTTFPISHISQSGLIPLWGVGTVNNLQLTAGVKIDAGLEIEMLRAVPKFTFKLDSEIKEKYVISSVSSSHSDFEQYGICQPFGSKNVSVTSALSEAERFNPVDASSEKGEVKAVHGLGTGEAWVYTGERECNSSDGMPLYFDVVLSPINGEDKKIMGKVYLCDYPDNKNPDISTSFERIVRNHDYQYVISLAELQMVVSFHEWIYGGKVHIELE